MRYMPCEAAGCLGEVLDLHIALVALLRLVRGPESEVVAQQLHDEGGILVRLLGQGVELGNGVVESLLGQVAGAVGGVEDLVIENGKVEGQTQADRVSGGKVAGGDGRGRGVSLQGLGSRLLAHVTVLELSKVSVKRNITRMSNTSIRTLNWVQQ